MSQQNKASISKLAYSNMRSSIPQESPHELELSTRFGARIENCYPVSNTVYINTLSFTVTVVEASGKRFQVQPKKHSKYKDVFVIRKNLKLDFQDHRDMVNYMVEQAKAVDERVAENKSIKDKKTSDNPEAHYPLYWLAKQFGDRNKPNTGWGNSNIWNEFYEDYVVASATDFDDRIIKGERVWTGEIYHTPTAVLISSRGLRQASPNPNEPLYSNQERIEILEENGRITNQDVVARFELISNDHNYLTRYILIGGRVEKLIPKKDESGKREDGVYYTYTTRDGHGGMHFTTKVEYCTYEEATERYGIYSTHEEAWNHGFRDKKLQSRIDELEQKNAILVKENENVKIKSDRDKLILDNKLADIQQRLSNEVENNKDLQRNIDFINRDREREREAQARREELSKLQREAELNEQKHKTEQQKAEFERQKMEFERLNQERKNTSETIKFISGTIIGVLSLVGAIIAFASRKK